MKNIYVTKPYLPEIEKYEKYLEEIWQNGILTNKGLQWWGIFLIVLSCVIIITIIIIAIILIKKSKNQLDNKSETVASPIV